MLIGRLVNAGVKRITLKKCFGHDNQSLNKWAAGLKSDNIDDMAEAFRGRNYLRKVTPEIQKYVSQQYFSEKRTNLDKLS